MPFVFFETANRRRIVEQEMDALPEDVTLGLLAAVQRRRSNQSLPLEDRQIDDDLWELRLKHDGNEYRLFYLRAKRVRVLVGVHAVEKKGRSDGPAIRKAQIRRTSWYSQQRSGR